MAVKKNTPLLDQLRDLADAAPRLRAAGVLSITVDGVSATLAPADAPIGRDDKPPKVESEPKFGDLDDAFGPNRRVVS